MKIKRIIKRIAQIIATGIIIGICVVLYANWLIPYDTQDYTFDNINDIPDQKVGMVLGTSRYIGHRQNLYFTYRIQAAKELYDAGKIKAFVVSGDNQHRSYNEPRDMKQALVEVGVPDSIIYLDYAGFRTLDSVVRMKEIFRQDSFIIISQKFHNERAIFLAQHYGLQTYGYNAKDLRLSKWSVKTKAREKLARVKVLVDMLTDKKPKFLGEPVIIN